MGHILVTGFEPFAEEKENPSGRLALALHGRTCRGQQIVADVLPVTYSGAPRQADTLVRRWQPRCCLLLGVAGSRQQLCLERVALNYADSLRPDNSGEIRLHQPLVPAAPAAYFSDLPLREWILELQARQIPCDLSLSAGSYVCNALYFHALHSWRCPALFVHVPRLNTLTWNQQEEGIALILERLAAYSDCG